MSLRWITRPQDASGVEDGEAKETARLEAFSDGVLAIAITLLVLDLRLPSGMEEASNGELWAEMLHLWPGYLAFVTSFAFIGIMWINHHRLFTHIKRCDTVLLLLNLLLLLGISVLPFPTAVLADHLGHPAEQTAALVYGGLFILIAIFYNLLWNYAARGNRLLSRNADTEAVRKITQQYMFGPLIYALAFLIAFVNVPLFLFAQLALAIFFAIPGIRPNGPA